MNDSNKLKKATFTLPESLLDKLRLYAEKNRVPSANAAVREAIEKYVAELEEEDFARAMDAAAKDPDFIKDNEDVEKDFVHADAETARMMPKW